MPIQRLIKNIEQKVSLKNLSLKLRERMKDFDREE